MLRRTHDRDALLVLPVKVDDSLLVLIANVLLAPVDGRPRWLGWNPGHLGRSEMRLGCVTAWHRLGWGNNVEQWIGRLGLISCAQLRLSRRAYRPSYGHVGESG